MPKQPRKSKTRAKQPLKKRPKKPKTPTGFRNPPPQPVSPETMQPSTTSKATFNRQAGENPDLDRAKLASNLFNKNVMVPHAPKTHAAQLRSLIPAAVMQKTLFDKLLTEHQDEIRELRAALAIERQENARLRALLATQNDLPSRKRQKFNDGSSVGAHVVAGVNEDGK